MVKTDILLQNAEKLFNDWFKDTKHPSGLKPRWEMQPSNISGIFIAWAKSGALKLDRNGKPWLDYYFWPPTKDTAVHPYMETLNKKIDWKDFRYSVVRTGTMITENECMYQAIGSFEAWLEQEVFCIKKYKPVGKYLVSKTDGMTSKSYKFLDLDTAKEYCNTTSVQNARCAVVVFDVHLKEDKPGWAKEWRFPDSPWGRLKYCCSARKKSMMELVPKEDDEEVTDAGPVPQPKLNVISGGMDGFNKDNWLEALPEGTVFQCIRKGGAEFVAMQFHVKRKWKKTCHLFSNFPVQQTGDLIAHYVNFSTKHELLEIQLYGKDWIRENDDVGRQSENSQEQAHHDEVSQ